MKYIVSYLIIFYGLIFYFQTSTQANSDPWQLLQQQYDPSSANLTDYSHKKKNKHDPWQSLRNIYLPFSFEEDQSILKNRNAGKKIQNYIHSALKPYQFDIQQCAEQFNIPEEILCAVIMVESAGNSTAKAHTSSASGLMQTIRSTFEMARNGLKKDGIFIDNNPFNPHSSIYAGSWYLNRMFVKASINSSEKLNRNIMNDWKYPLQYYYAGPAKGEEKGDIVFLYQNGKRILINKKAYSDKVLKWATLLSTRR